MVVERVKTNALMAWFSFESTKKISRWRGKMLMGSHSWEHLNPNLIYDLSKALWYSVEK